MCVCVCMYVCIYASLLTAAVLILFTTVGTKTQNILCAADRACRRSINR